MLAWAAKDRLGSSDVASRFSIRALLVGLLLTSLAGLVLGALHRAVNGDEFYFLTNIYRSVDNQPIGLLQTAYTHLFFWLPGVGGDELAQIKIGRLICIVIWVISLGFLYRLGTKLINPFGALAGVVFFALFSFSVGTASDFRIDGILLPVLLAIALLTANPSLLRVAAAGALFGVALALSVKAVLWAPAFVGLLLIGIWKEPRRLQWVFAGGSGAALTFIVIMLGHYFLISDGAHRTPAISAKGVATMGSQMLLEEGLFPKLDTVVLSVLQNPIIWTYLLIGLILTFRRVRDRRTARSSWTLLALALPLLSLAFYTNSFPYSYLVLIPTACLLAGQGFSDIVGDGKGLKGFVGLLSLAAASIPLFKSVWDNRTNGQSHQEQVLSVVHDFFEDPVPYIDGFGMISSFPRPIFPMSVWGFKGYKQGAAPLIHNYIENQHPPLLIVNTPALDVWKARNPAEADKLLSLLPEDRKAIRETYAHYWGQIYLAGHEWHDASAAATLPFNIVIPGNYTLLAEHRVVVDGQTYEPGSSLSLDAGPHTALTLSAEADLRILWGRATKIPLSEPSPTPLFSESFGQNVPVRCLLPMTSC